MAAGDSGGCGGAAAGPGRDNPAFSGPGAKLELATQGQSAAEEAAERRRLVRNLLVISFAFMAHFTAFVGATNLQSSVNAAAGLGTVSLALSHAALVLSSVFLPALVIRWLGCKGALVASFVAYMPYIAAQFRASYWTVAPAALLAGLAGGPFWCAQCVYVCALADQWGRRARLSRDLAVVRFFGVFYTVYEFGQIFGNLVSSVVLSAGWRALNATADVREVCGPRFCPGGEALANPNLLRPPDSQIGTVAGVYLACMAVSVLVLLLGLDPLSRWAGAGAAEEPLPGGALLRAAAALLRQPDQLLLAPLTVWLGLEKASIAADYTAAFVSCAWGIRHIGYVMMCYGAANSAAALLGGWAVKLTGRPPVVLTAAVLHAALLTALLIWRPHPDHAPFFFLAAGLWGACDGVWNVQVNALCGILAAEAGEERAAYSVLRLWESAGYILAYGYSAYVCAVAKLATVLGLLLLGVAGYCCIELRLHRRRALLAGPCA